MSAIRTLASTEKPLFSQASPEGVRLVFYQEKVPDPFWTQGKRGKRDRHRLLTQTEPVPAAAAADMLTWENSGFSIGPGG